MKHGGNVHRRGFTVIEMMVMVFVVAVLLFLVLPGLTRSRAHSDCIPCVNNLKQVGLSFRMWANDNHDLYPMQFYTNAEGGMLFADATNSFRYFQVLSNELTLPKILACRADERVPATNFTSDFNSSHVSYFVGLDAREEQPYSILAGDRKMTNWKGALGGVVDLTSEKRVGWARSIHDGCGNIAFGDGSVRKLTAHELAKVLTGTGLKTNRVVFP